MNYEEIARGNHRGGRNCAQSVFAAYAERMGMTADEAIKAAPRPRSQGGQCGAFLAGRAILERVRPEAVTDYEKAFIEANGMTECSRLVSAHGRLRKSCNDYVGDAARLVEAAIGE